jgi:2-keto-3-deoxy-L-rhamnonate aldolase RhmA
MMSWCMLPAFDYTICQMGGFDSLPVASLHIPQEHHQAFRQQIIHRPATSQLIIRVPTNMTTTRI